MSPHGEYQKAAAGALPDFAVRSARPYLLFRDIDIGAVDGILGPHTRSAIMQFQTDNGLAVTGEVDGALLQAIAP
jgi:peptidoglycan hydrolase-like protein with peptidoglycan-binding domain